ncbi:MAG: helix-turn-helix domain-containing protein, partial [Candidatus Pacebacteria bacterium]|nr:helix-turn-helix domain-containing protein [Candidatus Paceibacterota bacterium]
MRFKIKKIPSLKMSIGERLKRARRRKRLSLEEVEELTKVRKRYLEDIERNRFDNLPSDVYARGFLFKYASEVGLDPNEIVDLFSQERGLTNNPNDKGKLDDIPQKGVKYPRIIATPEPVATVIAILLILVFAGYIIFQVRGFSKAPNLQISKPVSSEMT